MLRRINFDSADFYCRYLDGQFFLPLSRGSICNGQFGYFLKSKLGIQRLPYQLSVSDLIIQQAVYPDLVVHLPNEYFVNWKNFPEIQAEFDPPLSGDVKAALWHSIHTIPTGTLSLEDLLHPYDREEFKAKFLNPFMSDVPKAPKWEAHENGHSYLPYEWYLSYWKAYVFVEALDGYEEIDKFLADRPGRAALVSRFTDVSQQWEDRYKETFTQVSVYRTAITILNFWERKSSITYGDLAKLLQGVINCNPARLEQSLEKLLILFAEWKSRSESGRRYYAQAIELLRQDIYFVLEWLCTLTGNQETFYFKRWSYSDRQAQVWADLKEVIPYEEFEFQQTFERLIPHYAETLVKSGYLADIQSTYERFSSHESFWPWIRAFIDLHRSLDQATPIGFKQVRVLDYLLVITIRTEILIRSIFRDWSTLDDDRDFWSVFNQFSQKCPEGSRNRRILGAVADRENWSCTELSGKPLDIFGNVDRLSPNRGWDNNMHHVFTSILRFITARNYFAHHSFKDESLNNQVSELAGRVLVSCIETVAYIDSVTRNP